jgi:Asp-tRNA(Asn)/Glu-tRNA(Gln) amidotransferase A subunit family amidase
MSDPELPFLTITQLAAAIRRREVSPVDVTEAMLQRIERIDPKVHAFISVTADLALRQDLRQLASFRRPGPLA